MTVVWAEICSRNPLSSDAQSSTQHLRAGQPCNRRPACFFSCWWSPHARGRHLHHEGLRPPKVLELLQGRASFRRRLISWVHRVAHHPSDRSPLCSSENGAFFCNECDCRFSEEASLKRHSLQVHSDKPYKCDRCQASFRYKGNLASHKTVHTGTVSAAPRGLSWFAVEPWVFLSWEQMCVPSGLGRPKRKIQKSCRVFVCCFSYVLEMQIVSSLAETLLVGKNLWTDGPCESAQ